MCEGFCPLYIKCMIKSKESLKFYLREDAKANKMGDCSIFRYWGRLIVGSESAHVYRYLKVLRLCEFHCNNGGILHKLLYKFYKIHLHRLGFKYNFRIPENICGYGISLYHFAGGGGCLVNAKSIGNYCHLQTGVLLGNAHHSEEEKPIIGNNVEFGPGAKVLGNVSVGNNVIVCANAVVTKDIPDNCIVAGVPAEIIKHILI